MQFTVQRCAVGADKDYFDMQIYLKDEDNHTYNGSNRGVYPIMYYDICDVICRASTGVNTYSENKTVKDITMKYSWGFCYILNDTSSVIYRTTDPDLIPSQNVGHYYFQFCNIRMGGPYEYILDVPTVKVDVMTMNEANQAYNIVGHVTNTADNHNENVQFISSMEGKVNALSNFRVRLLTDNFDPVKIRSPLTVMITVSNEED